MPSYIERRRRRWYAVLDVPKDLQDQIRRRRYVQSLGKTDSRSTAERLAAPLVARWKTKIDQARVNNGDQRDPLDDEARSWRESLLDAKDDDERELILGHFQDIIDERITRSAPRGWTGNPDETPYEDLPGYDEGMRLFETAAGKRVHLLEHLEEYADPEIDRWPRIKIFRPRPHLAGFGGL